MNALAQELLVVAKEYLGPAAPAFLSREFKALGVNANTIEPSVIYNHDSPTFKFDKNGFLVRPAPQGVFHPHPDAPQLPVGAPLSRR